MEQRSEALRLASIRKKNQINEVQTAKDIQMKQQQDRIQQELIKSQKQEAAALQGLEKLRLKRIERKFLSISPGLPTYDFAHAKINKPIFKILTPQLTEDMDIISNNF